MPGTTNIGSACDDCTTAITLPFAYTFYNNASTTSATVSSNGSLQFTSAVSPYTNACLPDATHNNAIFGLWDDLRTDAQAGCSGNPGGVCGVFTSTSGSAPNRIFNIEWRAVYFSGGTAVNFEIRLYENSPNFDIIYGGGTNASSATIGVQKGTGTLFTQVSCNTAGATSGTKYAFSLPPCGTATPTVTGTPPTATSTPLPPTPTATACGASTTGLRVRPSP